MDRRAFLGASAIVLATIAARGQAFAGTGKPAQARVIIDNDFAGDPDGLFQLAHHLLSPSLDIPLLVSSHLPVAFGGLTSAQDGVAKVEQLTKAMAIASPPPVLAGAPLPIANRAAWKPSPATAAIVREALREDTEAPLVYAAGASLTELALAWLAEPRIGRRLKLVWIGGREHPGLALPPPGPDEAEFNFTIDPIAAQVIFNESDIEIWQVPRDAYRQMLYSNAELDELAGSGPIGAFLKDELDKMAANLAHIPAFAAMPASETYVLGDSPLVTLTALLSPIQPDPSSSRYVAMPTPRLADDGRYQTRAGARPMRVYTAIDSRLTIRDMTAKFRAHARASGG
ncbi:nucleoside hydrolase [Novosphingobium profundi]|uniref:nucleoside hydrolase n=1 Tax=Novosphingobium profundi TaxID=1774954 RepID=UPI001BDB4E17|nr:nucleoside hydrolase [Novosphingobium profundi]MBT0669143.1 nucleoside hydrolase [Novosphingobium profundi]